MIIDFHPEHNDVKRTSDEPCKIIPLYEEKKIELEDIVHFNTISGFFMKDKTGEHIYQLGDIIQNIIVAVVSNLFRNK